MKKLMFISLAFVAAQFAGNAQNTKFGFTAGNFLFNTKGQTGSFFIGAWPTFADVKTVPDKGLDTIVPCEDMLLDKILNVKVSPCPVKANRRVTITVCAKDLSNGSIVSGQVIIGGQTIGATNVPITYTFKSIRKRVVSGKDVEWIATYPSGIVRADGYPDTYIDFGFPEP